MRIAKVSDGHREFWVRQSTDVTMAREIVGDYLDWSRKLTEQNFGVDLQLMPDSIPIEGLRFCAPFDRRSRVVIAGANYSKHLAEFGVEPVTQPIAFLKAPGALIGAYDPIRYPPLTSKLDYEVELVVVLGSADVDLSNPLASVLGYTVGNDVSARDLQRSGPVGIGMDLFAAKSQDRSTPVGPWIVTRDEFPASSPALRMTLKVNGDLRQDGNSGDMIWKVDELIKFVQERSSFSVGDILFTGTPSGVADATGHYLNVGDLVEAEIEKLGVMRNVVGEDR